MRTLVLNKGYYPIKHVSWKQAFRLICKGSAEAIEYYEEIVKTPNDFYFIPAVIKLTHYEGFPEAKVSYSKRAILERDDFCCQYCGCHLNYNSVTIDHVLPRSRGGLTTFENTVAACFPCNNKKGNRLNSECGLKLRKRPIKPDKAKFKLSICNTIKREWVDYLPRKMLDGVQIVD